MADLLDIAPSTSCEVVKINGTRLIVRGLHGDAIASLVARYPDLGFALGGIAAGIDPSRLLVQFGNAIGPIIAAGFGHLGDKEYEERAAKLLPDAQMDLVAAILRVTFPNGLLSFIAKLGAFMKGDEGAKPVVTVRAAKRSPSPSQPLSEEASRPTMQ